ncbi:hypothetical protein H2201_002895 [Coniosporium apollinis]|uniref:RING-type domain-containing protein n=1 Tax=Coniosporium apollinis TaxID=61459 RepID=A0ABQ9P0G1_9PEZI|nr:hypothetical protein H2201_002895 [Coniosporium apollinis]
MAEGQPSGLEKELTCSICTDVLYQPLTLLDCLHTFCGACLKEWFTFQASSTASSTNLQPYTCPSCRATVRSTRPNATVTTLLDMFLQANPGRGKTEQEKEAMRKQYKPGDDVVPKITLRGAPADTEDQRLMEQIRQLSLQEVGVRDSNLGESRPGRDPERTRETGRGPRDHHRAYDANRRSPGGTYLNYRPAEGGRRPHPSQRAASSRQVGHQSSLRSLLSASELDSTEMEEEIMRQILEEGLLDGIDLDNIDVSQEDEISERIAQAYRRRQRQQERERERERERRRQSQEHGNNGNQRPLLIRPLIYLNVHRAHEEAQKDNLDCLNTTVEPLIQRLAAPETNGAVTPSAQTRDLIRVPQEEQLSLLGPQKAQHQLSHQVQKPLYLPFGGQPIVLLPLLVKSYNLPIALPHLLAVHLQSEFLEGNFNLCLRCYRLGKGCLHWYGFGNAAWARYERQAPPGGYPAGHEHPHILTSHRYLPPSNGLVGPASSGEPLMSDEEPARRLQAGVFCDICNTFANACYWKCDSCNDGAWGFCNACVNQGRHCTHPLLPIAQKTATTAADTANTDNVPLPSQPSNPPQLTPKSASITRGPGLITYANTLFKPLTFTTNCDICHYPIPPSHTRFHCPRCNDGDYDICVSCYQGLVLKGRISAENGPSGWRRCQRGHRMLVVGFEERGDGQRRVVTRELVGGLALRDEDEGDNQAITTQRSNADARATPNWSWRDPDGTVRKARAGSGRETAPAGAVGMAQARFPSDGGFGLRVQALWGYYPAEGVEDELMFPKGAEIREGQDINGDWFWGAYAGRTGLFPGNYGRVV